MTTQLLPIAQPADVRRAAARLVNADRVAFGAVVFTSCAAAAAGLLAPWLVGQIVNEVQAGSGVAAVDRLGSACRRGRRRAVRHRLLRPLLGLPLR